MEIGDKYIYRVYLKRSFSKAAKELFISQPSLSATVAGREAELGFAVFDRSTKPASLTPEGKIYIDMLEEIMLCENNMQHKIEELKKAPQSTLSVGGASHSGFFLTPAICGAFSRRYPDVNLLLDVGYNRTGNTLFQKLDSRELDIVFSYMHNSQIYVCTPIFEDRIVVAMRRNMMTPELVDFALSYDELFDGETDEKKLITDTTVFKSISFLSFSRGGAFWNFMSELLGNFSVSQHMVVNVPHSAVHLNMMRSGIGAMAVGEAMIRLNVRADEDLVYFAFPREVSTRTMFAVTRKNDTPNEILKCFLEVAKEVGASDWSRSLYYQ